MKQIYKFVSISSPKIYNIAKLLRIKNEWSTSFHVIIRSKAKKQSHGRDIRYTQKPVSSQSLLLSKEGNQNG